MFNLSKETMRKLVKLTSGLFMNKKCPLWLQRKGLNLVGGYAPLPKSITVVKSQLANRKAWWFYPLGVNPTNHVILYFHGGGYGIGSPRSHRDLCAYLAKYSGVPVLSLDYRLAPEHPFPAALEDAEAAFMALVAKGIPAHNITLAGDSAGGGLALSLALKSIDQPSLQPGCLFLISPLVNMTRDTASHRTQLKSDPVINEGWSMQMADNYLRDPIAKQQACLADRNYKGIAPMLIHVGTDEVLLDDSLLLKQRAIQVGVHVKLMTYPELWHVFHFSPSLFKQARQALQQAGHYIRKQLKVSDS